MSSEYDKVDKWVRVIEKVLSEALETGKITTSDEVTKNSIRYKVRLPRNIAAIVYEELEKKGYVINYRTIGFPRPVSASSSQQASDFS